MPTEFLFDVFLSYNSKDKARVRRLAKRLKAAGLRVWFDEWEIKAGDDIYLAIERGLETARALVLCMSPAAFGSDWVGLERSTVLFRDPSNASRRFIPLLLADCRPPDNLRRYKYVDFRVHDGAAFRELLIACRTEVEAPLAGEQPRVKQKPETKRQPKQTQIAAVVERNLIGHTDWVRSVAISPDGKWVATGADDKTVKIWEVDVGECRATLEGHTKQVYCVAISADGKRILSGSQDDTIRIWDAQSGQPLESWSTDTGSVHALAPLACGQRVISGGLDGSLKLWEIYSQKCLATFKADGAVTSVALTPDDLHAVSGYEEGIKVWSLETGECLATLAGHAQAVMSVQITPDGRNAISSSRDMTVKAWDLSSMRCEGTLEGHKEGIRCVSVSPDGSLVASAGCFDHTVRIWNWKSGTCVQIIEQKEGFWPSSVAFSKDGTRLLVGNAGIRGMGWPSLFVYRLTGVNAAPLVEPTRRYVNAKVVLLGESGVGKSGLAKRLIVDKFVRTDSTHGMQVWRLDLPLTQLDNLECEALLWDLAGQEDYRLIHQLVLDETALALLLFNAQKFDPFSEVDDWLKVLRAAVPREDGREVAILLIAARADVGTAKVSQRKIDRFLQERRLADYLLTSAKRGDNCSDAKNGGKASVLKELIARYIPWAKLPWTSTPRLLADLKNAVLGMMEQKGLRLLRFAELVQRLEQTLPQDKFGESEVRTAVTLLANHGLVMPLKFGDLILLRPELLNGYASAVIRAARDHTDEIGCVKEQDVFDRSIDLSGVDRLEPADEELLVRALVQTFLDKSLCIAEDTPEGRQLIFPSQYRRERDLPQHPDVFVSYTFSGV